MKHWHIPIVLQSALAIGAGLLVTVGLSAAASLAHHRLLKKTRTGASDLWITGIYSVIVASAGGYVTAYIANLDPLRHVFMLAMALLLLAGMSALQSEDDSPRWFRLMLVGLTPAACLGGGLLRMYQAGYRW